MQTSFKIVFFVAFILSAMHCAGLPMQRVPTLELLNVYEIPFETKYKETAVGGLSGLDYDKKKDVYFMISDDRSEINNARIYEAKIIIKNDKIEDVQFQKVIFIKNKSQKFFTNRIVDPQNSTDPEDVRYNAKKKTLVWTSEGERIVKPETSILSDPTINEISLEGDFKKDFALPLVLKMSAGENGPRKNGALEGLSYNRNYSKLFANIEEPLYEDGPQATTTKGGIVRLFEFDAKSFKNTRQYYYPLEAVAKNPYPAGSFSVNGVSSILNYKKNLFLFVERSYSVGTTACTIKVFQVDLNTAQTSLNLDTISTTKKLVLNMDTLGIFTDNIEGITFGPKLSTGEQSLIFVSDNNFSKDQKTQLLLFKLK